ncbi:MAG: hypothetical protein WD733_10055 [Bryobacterales bacterium]
MVGRTIRARVFAVCAAFLLALPLAAADFSIAPGVALPDGVADNVKSLLRAEGVTVKSGAKVAVEIWAREKPFEAPPTNGFGIRMETLPEGGMIALVRFPEGASDFREQAIPPGIYTLRFGLHPEDGNHMGVASSRDFALLTPVDKDPDPAKVFPFKELIELTKQVGNPHPTIVRLEMAESSETPHLWEQDSEHWVLDLDIAGEPVGFVVHGHSEE